MATSWLSKDLLVLADEIRRGERQRREGFPRDEGEGLRSADEEGFHFDVVIAGSGYGGGIALKALAGYGREGRQLRIAMLERGSEYLPGSFPSRMSDLPGHVRVSAAGDAKLIGQASGLYDLRVGPDIGVLLANGLGGGSLINAGVLAKPRPEVFADPRWPRALREDPAFLGLFDSVADDLGASPAEAGPDRAAVMAKLGFGPNAATRAPVTVAFDDERPHLSPCNRCGDCATGCNFGAKISVDVSLISGARRQHDPRRLEIVTGATVKTFKQLPGGWSLAVIPTREAVHERVLPLLELKTRYLILCAGALGSTELLIRTALESNLPLASDHLGSGFSGNGDSVVLVEGADTPTGAVSKETLAFADRNIGPTITRMIDLRDEDPSLVIQDLAVPGPLRRLLEEVNALTELTDSLVSCDRQTYPNAPPAPVRDPLKLSDTRTDHSIVLAVIGRDDATGTLALPDSAPNCDVGTLNISWRGLGSQPQWDAMHQRVAKLVSKAYPKAKLRANPLWRPLPTEIESLFGAPLRGALTVHPLGGCRMADSGSAGVVNHLGQVFTSNTGTHVHENLVVLDGSIVPTSLGINPALTIATLSRRAIIALRDEVWGFQPTQAAVDELTPRPLFAAMPEQQNLTPTAFQFAEQMSVPVCYDETPARLELELWSQPVTVADLIYDEAPQPIKIDPDRSRIRIRSEPTGLQPEVTIGQDEGKLLPTLPETLFEAYLSGSITLFEPADSGFAQRTFRALHAWLLNRGMRDLLEAFRSNGGHKLALRDLLPRLKATLALASRAGNAKLIKYELKFEDPPPATAAEGNSARVVEIRATKTLTYGRAANPAVQLMEARVDLSPDNPRLLLQKGQPLRVDLPFFAKVGHPLVRVIQQENQVQGLVDLASLMAYVGRTLLPLHAWTLRLPDPPINALPPNPRLPRDIPGTGAPTVALLPIGDAAARLTHFPRKPGQVERSPVLCIHGYSASGTTFAHEKLRKGGLAGALCELGHDVWVLDLRTSSGMPTATMPWTFDEIANQDIPLAIQAVWRASNSRRVDIVAHCIGAAMFSLALFRESDAMPDTPTSRALAELPNRIGKIVFSQVGPAVVMSPANVARAYLAQRLRHYLSITTFNIRPGASAADNMLDRLLCALPYPREDFRVENPPWEPWKSTRWVAQRHRLDLLFGSTFKLSDPDQALKVMDPEVLESIDEFFGPVNLATLSQVIWFARYRLITDACGRTTVMTPERIADRLAGHPVLALHSAENGVIDPETRNVLIDLLASAHASTPSPGGNRKQATLSATSVEFAQMGHQDSLIGSRSDEVYSRIASFLRQEHMNTVSLQDQKPKEREDSGLAQKLKARAASGLASTARVEHFRLTCQARYHLSNGLPKAATLLPVGLTPDRRWRLLDFVSGTPIVDNLTTQHIRRFSSAGIQAGDSRLGSLPIDLPWPKAGGRYAEYALLLLIHDQVERAGDPVGGLLLPTAEAIRRCLAYRPSGELDGGVIRRRGDAGGGSRFALASCQYPAGIFDGSTRSTNLAPDDPDIGPADWSMWKLAKRCRQVGSSIRAVILCGDQVYVDATAGIFDPKTPTEAYQFAYDRFLENPNISRLLRLGVDVFPMMDDHEYMDNWDGSEDPLDIEGLQEAKRQYLLHQRAIWPGPISPAEPNPENPVPLWAVQEVHGFDFFFFDSRTERTPRTLENWEDQTIASEDQFNALELWLSQRQARPAFIVSPSMVLPRTMRQSEASAMALHEDAWGAFPSSLHRLLALLHAARASRVVLLSGDEHLSSVTRIAITKQGDEAPPVVVHSVHSSALYAPYPFANSRAEDFASPDEFGFSLIAPPPLAGEYRCSVRVSHWFPGDGFALFDVVQAAGGSWHLNLEFDRANDSSLTTIELR